MTPGIRPSRRRRFVLRVPSWSAPRSLTSRVILSPDTAAKCSECPERRWPPRWGAVAARRALVEQASPPTNPSSRPSSTRRILARMSRAGGSAGRGRRTSRPAGLYRSSVADWKVVKAWNHEADPGGGRDVAKTFVVSDEGREFQITLEYTSRTAVGGERRRTRCATFADDGLGAGRDASAARPGRSGRELYRHRPRLRLGLLARSCFIAPGRRRPVRVLRGRARGGSAGERRLHGPGAARGGTWLPRAGARRPVRPLPRL